MAQALDDDSAVCNLAFLGGLPSLKHACRHKFTFLSFDRPTARQAWLSIQTCRALSLASLKACLSSADRYFSLMVSAISSSSTDFMYERKRGSLSSTCGMPSTFRAKLYDFRAASFGGGLRDLSRLSCVGSLGSSSFLVYFCSGGGSAAADVCICCCCGVLGSWLPLFVSASAAASSFSLGSVSSVMTSGWLSPGSSSVWGSSISASIGSTWSGEGKIGEVSDELGAPRLKKRTGPREELAAPVVARDEQQWSQAARTKLAPWANHTQVTQPALGEGSSIETIAGPFQRCT